MTATINDLGNALSTLAAHTGRLAEQETALAAREADLSRREAELAAAMEQQSTSALWAQATAARDNHWRMMIALQLEHLSPHGATATVLRHLQVLAVGEG
jgi:hypothetical protein